jgi:hypothetical protein
VVHWERAASFAICSHILLFVFALAGYGRYKENRVMIIQRAASTKFFSSLPTALSVHEEYIFSGISDRCGNLSYRWQMVSLFE